MTSKTPFDLMMDQTRELMKSFPAMEAFSPKSVEQAWPTMPKELMEALFGNAINEGGLDAKSKLLLTLAGLTMQGVQNETAYRQTLRHLREVGAGAQEIYEAITMMSLFAGMPASTRGMELAKDVIDTGKDEE